MTETLATLARASAAAAPKQGLMTELQRRYFVADLEALGVQRRSFAVQGESLTHPDRKPSPLLAR